MTPLRKAWDEWGYFVPIIMNFMITWLSILGCSQCKVTVSWIIVMVILIMICVMESLLMPWLTYMYRSENKFMQLFLSTFTWVWGTELIGALLQNLYPVSNLSITWWFSKTLKIFISMKSNITYYLLCKLVSVNCWHYFMILNPYS